MIIVNDYEQKEYVVSDDDVYLEKKTGNNYYIVRSKYTDIYFGELPIENARDFVAKKGLGGSK